MSENQPLTEEWKELYRLARKIKEIEPWNLMGETDIFGLRNPENGEFGFVSVMGMEGMHFAVAVYLGKKALYDFWNFQYAYENNSNSPEQIMEIPQLQLSYENRGMLDKNDLKVIKNLKIKFRGKNAWPMFRSIQTGYLPWYLTSEEARFLTYALEQIVDLFPRFQEDEYLLDYDDNRYLVRNPAKKGNSLVWEDKIMEILPPDPEPIPIMLNDHELRALKNRRHGNIILEIDFFIIPAQIGKKDQRPSLPYMLMAVESKSGMVVGHETFLADHSLEDMWGKIPGVLVHQFFKSGILPREIIVRSSLLFLLLQPVAEELKILISQSENLHSLDEAKESLLKFIT